MRQFTALFARIDESTKTNAKVAALSDYLRTAPTDDRLWAIALFTGRRPKRVITTTKLRLWAAEVAGLEDWLFDESYHVVGDLAETIRLVLPPPSRVSEQSLTHWITWLKSLGAEEESDRKTAIVAAWDQLAPDQRFLFNKLLTGGFRVGVGAKLMTRALSAATGQNEATLAHKLMGQWSPDTATWDSVIVAEDPRADLSRPYPFYLAHPVDVPEDLGTPELWHAERKWDGIRGQVVLRGAEYFVWSRGEELMTDRFPEFARLQDYLPDGTVIDGEILGYAAGAPLSFNSLQTRIGRKTVPKKVLTDAPVILMAYDLLEHEGTDLRQMPFDARRAILAGLLRGLPADAPIRLSPEVTFVTWDDLGAARAQSREFGAEGLMIKRRESPYLIGRKRGDWWKWKVDPLTIDAVLIYAQAGHGRRANLFTDYTFAVWDGDVLTPFTKAYSGLTDTEFGQVTAWVRKNTMQKFGPVRQVTPQHVFEIAFEGIQASTRHKSGVALRFPRMLRWRKDKPLAEANTLDDLKEMLALYG